MKLFLWWFNLYWLDQVWWKWVWSCFLSLISAIRTIILRWPNSRTFPAEASEILTHLKSVQLNIFPYSRSTPPSRENILKLEVNKITTLCNVRISLCDSELHELCELCERREKTTGKYFYCHLINDKNLELCAAPSLHTPQLLLSCERVCTHVWKLHSCRIHW